MAIQDRKQLTKNLFFDPIGRSIIIVNNYVDPATEFEIPFVDVASLRSAIENLNELMGNVEIQMGDVVTQLTQLVEGLEAIQEAFKELDGNIVASVCGTKPDENGNVVITGEHLPLSLSESGSIYGEILHLRSLIGYEGNTTIKQYIDNLTSMVNDNTLNIEGLEAMINASVKTVNGVGPDENGNITIDVSGMTVPITVGGTTVEFNVEDFLNQIYSVMSNMETNMVKSVNNALPVNGNITLDADMISGMFSMIDPDSGAVAQVNTNIETFLATLVSTIYNGYAKEVAFQAHVNTDLNRWKWVTELRAQVADLQAGIANKVLDRTAGVDIEAQSTSETGYVVNNALGGRIEFTAFNLLLSFGTVSLNGNEVWSSAGLSLSISGISDSWEVEDGDVITTGGLTSVTYYPYVQG